MSYGDRCNNPFTRAPERLAFAGESTRFVDVAPALERVGDFSAFLGEEFDQATTYAALRKAESVGRPVGSKAWLADMEQRTAPQFRGHNT